MKSIETGLAAVEQCIEDAHYNITDANKIHEELTWAVTNVIGNIALYINLTMIWTLAAYITSLTGLALIHIWLRKKKL